MSPGAVSFTSAQRRFAVLVALLGLSASASMNPGAMGGEPQSSPKVDFNFQVRPILSDKCFRCHGPDARERKAGLRFDTREGAFAETESGARAIVPGNLAESELYGRITAKDETERMPTKSLGRTLSAGEIEVLRRWIEQGAEWQTHWSFRPPVAAAAPDVKHAGWPRNPIDRFVLARLEAENRNPSPEADKEHLIRRVTFDLTGLPPTLEEIDDFLADRGPGAYERVVDRLLASPRFGERIAVDWLDLARYADTYGYQADRYRATWPWQNWVVRALQRQSALRSVRHVATGRRLVAETDARPGPGDGVQPAPSPDQRRWGASRRSSVSSTSPTGRIHSRPRSWASRSNVPAAIVISTTRSPRKSIISCHELLREHRRIRTLLALHRRHAGPRRCILIDAPTGIERDRRGQQGSDGRCTLHVVHLEVDAVDVGGRCLDWLMSPKRSREPVIAGLIGDFPLEAIEGGKVANRADAKKPGQTSEDPEVVEGKVGRGLHLSGENNVTLPMGNFDRSDPFSLAMWIKTPEYKDRAR